ncbi:hypothetical protein M1D72_05825 [Vibrio sp. AK197]
MKIPFDNNSGEKYTLDVVPNEIESGDGVVITLNQKACEAFAQLFSQLAKEPNGAHIHLGYDESEPQGPGVRLVRNDNT